MLSLQATVSSLLGVSEEELVAMEPADRARQFIDENSFRNCQTDQRTSFGSFSVVTVSELARDVVALTSSDDQDQEKKGKVDLTCLTVQGGVDIGRLQGRLATQENSAMVQVFSNFNCLENSSKHASPYTGKLVDLAARDSPQGAEAAFGCLSAYLYRAHFFRASADNSDQINLLSHVGQYFGTPVNGKLQLEGNEKPLPIEESEVDTLVGDIAVGLHTDCPILFGRDPYINPVVPLSAPYERVDQLFTSTINLNDTGQQMITTTNTDYCRILLRAAYEATYLAAIRQQRKQLYLTMIGEGFFGNPKSIIVEELQRAHVKWANHPSSQLEVCQLCCYAQGDDDTIRDIISKA